MKKQKLVKALLYRVEICDSILDHVHGAKYKIAEIFVPKAKLIMNEKGGVFFNDKPRDYNSIEVKVSQKLISEVKRLVTLTSKVKPKIEKLFSEILKEIIENNFMKQQSVATVDTPASQIKTYVSSGVIELNKRGMDNPADA